MKMKSEINNTLHDPTIPNLSVSDAVDLLAENYIKLIENHLELRLFPSTMLWGPPGVGKSQAIREIAAEIEEKTKKKVHITDVRLLLFNPVDLRGIPTFNKDRTLAIWLKPKIFDMDTSDDVVNILFLDEVTAAPSSVQASAYQITLDRTVGEHKLPDNCIVFLAGNRTSDRSVSNKMPKALSNRLMHIEIKADFLSFKRWAIKNHINEKVIGFLSFHTNYLNDFSTDNDFLAYATPRTWEMVSNILNHICPDLKKARPLIEGLISVGLTTEFYQYCKIYNQLPTIEDIFDGKCTSAPKQVDALYALVSSMSSYAYSHKDDMKQIANSIGYAQEYLPADFSYLLINDYLYFEDNYREKLLKLTEFRDWLRTKGKLFNAVK